MSIICISREVFSGGRALAEGVAEKLGYRCISREVLVEAARNHGVPVEKLEKTIDEVPGIFDRMHIPHIQRGHYLIYAMEALAKAVKDERVVYHGLAGHLLLRGVPHVLRVNVVANTEFRTKVGMDRLACTKAKAIEFIKNTDKRRDKWLRAYHNVDRNDPSLHDLVISLDRISLPSACDIVCSTAGQKEFQATPESQKRLRDLVLSSEVRAKIASDGGINDEGVEVEADDGVVTLRGAVPSLADADKIREVVRQVPSVKDIKSEMRARAQL